MVKKIISLEKSFGNCDSVYPDTNIFIYLFQDSEKYSGAVEAIFDFLESKMINVCFSSLLLTELLVFPFKNGLAYTAGNWLNYFKVTENIHVINLDPKIAVDAAFLRAKYNIKTPDSVQLATAMQRKNSLFLTNDRELLKVGEVKMICLEDCL